MLLTISSFWFDRESGPLWYILYQTYYILRLYCRQCTFLCKLSFFGVRPLDNIPDCVHEVIQCSLVGWHQRDVHNSWKVASSRSHLHFHIDFQRDGRGAFSSAFTVEMCCVRQRRSKWCVTYCIQLHSCLQNGRCFVYVRLFIVRYAWTCFALNFYQLRLLMLNVSFIACLGM